MASRHPYWCPCGRLYRRTRTSPWHGTMPAPRRVLRVVRKVVAPSCPFASGHSNAVAEASSGFPGSSGGGDALPLPIRLPFQWRGCTPSPPSVLARSRHLRRDRSERSSPVGARTMSRGPRSAARRRCRSSHPAPPRPRAVVAVDTCAFQRRRRRDLPARGASAQGGPAGHARQRREGAVAAEATRRARGTTASGGPAGRARQRREGAVAAEATRRARRHDRVGRARRPPPVADFRASPPVPTLRPREAIAVGPRPRAFPPAGRAALVAAAARPAQRRRGARRHHRRRRPRPRRHRRRDRKAIAAGHRPRVFVPRVVRHGSTPLPPVPPGVGAASHRRRRSPRDSSAAGSATARSDRDPPAPARLLAPWVARHGSPPLPLVPPGVGAASYRRRRFPRDPSAADSATA